MADETDDRTIRHELRTPVNHILGYAELLLEVEETPAGISVGLQEIRKLGREVLTLVLEFPGGNEQNLSLLRGVVERLERAAMALTALQTPATRPDIQRILLATERLSGVVAGLRGAAGGTPDPAPAATMGDANILVVDDEPTNRDVLSRRLVRLGYKVTEAADGAAALFAMGDADNPVDLVLLDLMMPNLDGFAVLEQRHETPALRDIPVIMITAADPGDGLIRCIELGAVDYLPKPFDPVLLKARIGACLENKRLRDAEKNLLATVSGQAEQLRVWNQQLEQRVSEKVREVERLSRMERFLPPQLAQVIANGGDEVLRSHRSEITVLFCDLRGFTSFSETAEPEDVMGVLREMHNAVGPLVFELGGTLAQFTGDGMMVFFNDPIPCDDPAWRAVQLGLGMRDRVAALATVWRRRGYELALGVGIAVGHATCGQYGFEGRMEYSAIGNVTNLAARLCSEAEGGQVLISQRVSMMIDGRADLEHIGDLVLKGLARPMGAYNVVAIRS